MAAITADIVGLIRKTILDSYKFSDGFPILKELIQNANDADATELQISFSDGIKNAEHELLREPAIIVYDNGNFTKANKQGLLRIADNNKESDNTKIGKFGLGMKSIFHLCDMCFFAINTSNQKDGLPFEIDTINPWEEDFNNQNTQWIPFSDKDKDLFEKNLPIDMRKNHGFLLWIPEKNKDKNAIHIMPDIIDLRNPFKNDLYSIIDKLKTTLALLYIVSPSKTRLNKITLINNKVSFVLEVVNNNNLCIIKETSDRKVENMFFESYKPTVSENIPKEIIEKEFWKNNKDKDIDCNLVFVKQPLNKNEQGHIYIQYCVYLPLEKPEIEIPIEYNVNYFFLLHGNFSVDSGRTGIQGYSDLLTEADISTVDDSAMAIRYWNKFIAQNTLYPNIPAFFNSIANNSKLNCSDDEIKLLINSISSFNFENVPIINRNKYVTTKNGFAYCYQKNGKEIIKNWTLLSKQNSISSQSNYVYIPDTDNTDIISSVFPSLFDNESYFICKSMVKDYILPEEYLPNEHVIFNILDNVVFTNSNEINILIEFLKLNKNIIYQNERLQAKLVNVLKKNLLKMDISFIYKEKKTFENLFEAVNEITGIDSLYKVYSIGNKDKNKSDFEDSDWFSWWEKNSKFIFVPGFIQISENCTERALIDGADGSDSVCRFVSEYVTNGEQQFNLISGIYENYKQSYKRIIDLYPELCLFQIKNVRENTWEYENNHFLDELKHSKELFFPISNEKDREPLYLFSLLQSNFPIYTISKDILNKTEYDSTGILDPKQYNCIFESLAIHQDYKLFTYDREVLPVFLESVFKNKPKLANDYSDVYDECDVIRFLISSFDTELESEEPLFIYEPRCNPVWRKIFDQCRKDIKIISPDFGSYTRDTIIDNENVLNIHILNDSTCIEAFKLASMNKQVDFMNDKYFQNDDILFTILKELNYMSEKDIFYNLPIHIDSKTKQRKVCSENCYLNIYNIEFPEGFNNPFTLFDLYDNQALSEKQKDFFGEKKTLNYMNSINIYLRSQKNEIDSNWICSQIKSSGSRDLSNYLNKDELGLIEWIPILHEKNSYCSLRSIIKKGMFSSETENTLRKHLPLYTQEQLDIDYELLENRKLLISDMDTEFEAIVDIINKKNVIQIPIESFDDFKLFSEILKDDADFPQFGVSYAFLQDNNLSDKHKILTDFYSKIRTTTDDTYELICNLINNSVIGKSNTVSLFNLLLKQLLTNSKEQFNILDIKQYPTLGNDLWKAPEKIAATKSSFIDKEYQLNQETYNLIEDYMSENSNNIIEDSDKDVMKILTDESSPDEIINVFTPWIEQLKQVKLVYLFLYLCKDNYKKTALLHKNENDFECFTSDFNYNVIPDYESTLWSHGYSQKQAIEDKNDDGSPTYYHFHTKITFPIGDETYLHSLTGQKLKVLLNKSTTSGDYLYLETPYYNYSDNYFYIPLAKISSHDVNLDEKLKILIEKVLKSAYFQHQNAIEINRVLDTIIQTNEYSVKATSIQIMDEIFGLFKQLRLNTNEFVKEYSKQERELSRSKATGKFSSSEYMNRKEEIIEEIRNLLEMSKESSIDVKTKVKDKFGCDNPEELARTFRKNLRIAVMNKIIDNQYDEESVIFELLQNADDAVKDIEAFSPKCDFEVHSSSDKKIMYISHYGREINQCPPDKNPSKYLDDLYNMLTINGSNKVREDNDTGKFGLGFKSVHLICTTPIIRSGDLQFKIVGGIYPKTIVNEKLDSGETRFELKLQEKYVYENLIKDFKKNATIQTIFCKGINTIKIDGFSYHADKKLLEKKKNGELYSVSFDKSNYLLFQNLEVKHPFSILMKLNIEENKVERILKGEFKKIWNTTPLSDCETLPFVMNSDFIPDTGRKHLADKRNDELLKDVANSFALLLLDFFHTMDKALMDSILDLLILTSNIRDKFFPTFAKDTLKKIFELEGLLSSGYGTTIEATRELVYIEPTTFGQDPDKCYDFMIMIQDYLDFVSNRKYYLMSGVAKKCYEGTLVDNIDSITQLSEFVVKYIPNKQLSNEIFEKFLLIVEKAKNSKINIDWNSVYLLNQKNSWIKASKIIIESILDIPEQQLHDSYSQKVIKFLENELPKDSYINYLNNQQNGDTGDVDTEENLYNIPSVEDVYSWWKKEKESGSWQYDVELYYSAKGFPSVLQTGLKGKELIYSPEELFNMENKIPKEWCILLWIAAAQSMPNNWGNKDASNKKGFEVLDSFGVFDSFCNGENIQNVYDLYLDKTNYDETRIRLFEMLLRIYKYRRKNTFADLYDLFANLPSKSINDVDKEISKVREKDENKNSKYIWDGILIPTGDSELSGCDIQLPPGNRTFSIGIRLIIQNLALCGFWEKASELEMKNLFKAFRNYRDRDLEKIENKEYIKEFYSCLDLPFLIYSGKF